MTYGFKMANNVTDLRVTGIRCLSLMVAFIQETMQLFSSEIVVFVCSYLYPLLLRYAKRRGG